MNPELGPYGGGVPAVDVSAHGHLIDSLMDYINLVNGVFFLLVVAVLVWAAIAYRARRTRKAEYIHGTSKRDFWLAAVLRLTVFLTLDLAIVFQASRALETAVWNYPTEEQNPLRVEVLAQQWAWNIRYAGPDNEFNTADDAVTLNDLRVPVGRPVLFNIRSRDVIHSFNLPNFRVKMDAVPGITTRAWFQVDPDNERLRAQGFPRPVRFNIACAQMCGWAHYAMAGYVTVYTPQDFDRWMAQAVTDGRLRYTDPATIQDADLRRREVETHWGWPFEGWGADRHHAARAEDTAAAGHGAGHGGGHEEAPGAAEGRGQGGGGGGEHGSGEQPQGEGANAPAPGGE